MADGVQCLVTDIKKAKNVTRISQTALEDLFNIRILEYSVVAVDVRVKYGANEPLPTRSSGVG